MIATHAQRHTVTRGVPTLFYSSKLPEHCKFAHDKAFDGSSLAIVLVFALSVGVLTKGGLAFLRLHRELRLRCSAFRSHPRPWQAVRSCRPMDLHLNSHRVRQALHISVQLKAPLCRPKHDPAVGCFLAAHPVLPARAFQRVVKGHAGLEDDLGSDLAAANVEVALENSV